MKIEVIKTKKIVAGDDLFMILDEYLPEKISDRSIIVVSSKIVAICEGRIVKKLNDKQRDELAIQESELYIPRNENQYHYMLTVNHGVLSGSGGIDNSNGNGNLVLWPKNPQKSANQIREYLVKKFKKTNIGVIIADSKSTPLRWGATGFALAHSGFLALKDYRGVPDVFGRKMQSETANIYDALAASAVLNIGEGNEQRPLAIITDVNFVNFQKRNPTKKELDFLKLTIETDFYAPILTKAKWIPGKSRKSGKKRS